MKINFHKIIPLSFIEWPLHNSMIVFFNGCNFKCQYCQNKHLLTENNIVDILTVTQQIYKIISQNSNRPPNLQIDSICFTGGEPTMQLPQLKYLLEYSKNLNLKTMLETNGYYPENIKQILHLIDEIHIDIKGTPAEYYKITGISDSYKKLKQTLSLSSRFHKRTTIFKDFKIPKNTDKLQRGQQYDSPLTEYTIEEFEHEIHKFLNK